MKSIGLCVCCLLALGGVVSGAESYEYASSGTEGIAIGSSGSLSVSQFDSDLGTLTQVEVAVPCLAIARLQLTNSSETQDYEGEYGPAFDVSSSISAVLLGETVTSLTGSFENTYSPVSLEAGGSMLMDPLYAYDTGYLTYTDASDLALFTGTGTISLLLSSSGSTDIDPPADLPAYVEATSGHVMCGEIWVTYNYTPVPEPATLGLFVVGASCLLRRKRAK